MFRKNHLRERIQSKQSPSSRTLRFAGYLVVFGLIVGLAYSGHASDSIVVAERQTGAERSSLDEFADVPSVDQVVASDLAANIATGVDLPIATNVTNQAISVTAKSELSQTNDDTISKPQTTQAAGAVSHDIVTYTTQSGDTADSVATKFKLSKDTIKWSNNLQGDAIEPNRTLIIPPVDGVVATAQGGDTVETLAQKYGTQAERILLFNDFDNGVVTAGAQVIVPGGRIAAAPPVVVTAPGGGSSSSQNTNVNFAMLNTSDNRYDYGYCTWYAFNRRAALGKPIGGMWGNASSWASLARASGFSVNNTPSVGAVMQTAYGAGGYGHVAVVESVNSDGSVLVSEMNYAGWNRKSSRTLSAAEALSYNFIH